MQRKNGSRVGLVRFNFYMKAMDAKLALNYVFRDISLENVVKGSVKKNTTRMTAGKYKTETL